MPKASTFGALTASQVINSDSVPLLTNAGDNKRVPISELRQVVGPGWLNVQFKGADPTGNVASDTAFVNALAESQDVYVPPGTYKLTAPLTIPLGCRLMGVPRVSILKPTVAVTTSAVILQSNTQLMGLYIDGVDTTGVTGIDLGHTSFSNWTVLRDCEVWRFQGTGAVGIQMGQQVTTLLENVYSCQNEYGMITNGGTTPTDTLFMNCAFRESIKKGVWVESGYSLNFLKCLFEANQEEGFYIQNAGNNAVEIQLYDAWFEGNWQSLSGAPRHAEYSFHVDGDNGPAGTIRTTLRDCKFDGVSPAPKAIHLTNAVAFLIDHVNVVNEADQVLIDGTSYGHVVNWSEQSGLYPTTVSIGGSAFAHNSRQHIEDIELARDAVWTSYTPSFSASGSMTYTSVTNQLSRYKVVGKTVTISHTFIGTTGGSAGQAIKATLPTNIASQSATPFYNAMVSQDGGGTYEFAIAQPDSVGPTSTVNYYLKNLANWGLGAGRAISATFTFEMV